MKQRDESIDIFKGLLVFGMIFSHVTGLISNYTDWSIKFTGLFMGIISFSGFMFSFGYVSQKAYFRKHLSEVYKRMFITGLKPLIAFYISGIYFRVFMERKLSWETISKIILLEDIPPFSEFLVSFSLVILLVLVLFRPLKKIIAKPKIFWILFFALLLTTFIPYNKVTIDQLGLLIGTTRFPSFSVLQYMPLYLLGAYFAENKIAFNKKLFVVSMFGPILFVFYYLLKHSIPSRFPPSFVWIFSSMFFIYLYYLFSRFLMKNKVNTQIIQSWGKNVLFYLLLSNIIIFTFSGLYGKAPLNSIKCLGITCLIIAIINFLISIVTPSREGKVIEQRTVVGLASNGIENNPVETET